MFWGGCCPQGQTKGRWAQPGSRGRGACPSTAWGSLEEGSGLGAGAGSEESEGEGWGFSGTSDPAVGPESAQQLGFARQTCGRWGGTGFPAGDALHPPHPRATGPVTVGSVRGQGGRGLFLETGAGWGPGTLSAWGWQRGLATSLPQPGYLYQA